MSRKVWKQPVATIQKFAPNEYVAACYSLYCLVSGDGNRFTGNTWHDGHGAHGREAYNDTTIWHGLSTPLDGQLHGAPCANGSSLNTATSTYYEYHKASAVGNITLGADAGNGRQYAVWTSEDVNGTGHYSHYGYAVLDDKDHPNHS